MIKGIPLLSLLNISTSYSIYPLYISVHWILEDLFSFTKYSIIKQDAKFFVCNIPTHSSVLEITSSGFFVKTRDLILSMSPGLNADTIFLPFGSLNGHLLINARYSPGRTHSLYICCLNLGKTYCCLYPLRYSLHHCFKLYSSKYP